MTSRPSWTGTPDGGPALHLFRSVDWLGRLVLGVVPARRLLQQVLSLSCDLESPGVLAFRSSTPSPPAFVFVLLVMLVFFSVVPVVANEVLLGLGLLTLATLGLIFYVVEIRVERRLDAELAPTTRRIMDLEDLPSDLGGVMGRVDYYLDELLDELTSSQRDDLVPVEEALSSLQGNLLWGVALDLEFLASGVDVDSLEAQAAQGRVMRTYAALVELRAAVTHDLQDDPEPVKNLLLELAGSSPPD